MKMDPDRNFKITRYRAFHDVPRTMLAVDAGGAKWIFDSTFDEAVDDYKKVYAVYPLLQIDAALADVQFDQHCRGVSLISTGEVPVASLQFDDTRRKGFTLVLAKGLSEIFG